MKIISNSNENLVWTKLEKICSKTVVWTEVFLKKFTRLFVCLPRPMVFRGLTSQTKTKRSASD